VVVHGIPSTRPLNDGDTLNVDVSIFYDGYHGDNNLMIEIGKFHPDIKRLINITRKAVYEAIKICRPGEKINRIGQVIEEVASSNGVYICELFNGHGIGQQLHMPPVIHPYCNRCLTQMNLDTITSWYLETHSRSSPY
jgi:methionyl aminopeptidase